MNRLNRKLEYSMMALKHIASKHSDELTTAKEIADYYKAPFDATARVMQLMAQKGLLKAELGSLGGYKISKDLSKVSLLDLLEAVQGPNKIARCMDKSIKKTESCGIQAMCNIISPILNLNKKMNEFYGSLMLNEILFR